MQFVAFLVCVMVGVGGYIVRSVVEVVRGLEGGWKGVGGFLGVFVCSTPAFVSLGMLVGYHFAGIGRNVTTNEDVKKVRREE